MRQIKEHIVRTTTNIRQYAIFVYLIKCDPSMLKLAWQ